MSKMSCFLFKNRKRLAFATASVMVGVTCISFGTLWVTRSDSTPIMGRNRILINKPSWDIKNGELEKSRLEDTWQTFRSEPDLQQKLHLLGILGVGKLIEVEKMSSELEELLKSMSWKVESALPIYNFYGIAFTTSNGNILCDRRWVNRGRGFNGVLAHEMCHAICRHANEKEFWKYLIISLPLLSTISFGLFGYAISMNPIVALPIAFGIFAVTLFTLFGFGFRLLRRMEHEADLVGMMLMAWARIHPSEVHEALHSLDWLMNMNKNTQTEWTDKMFHAYPTIAERRALVDDFFPTALEAYHKEMGKPEEK